MGLAGSVPRDVKPGSFAPGIMNNNQTPPPMKTTFEQRALSRFVKMTTLQDLHQSLSDQVWLLEARRRILDEEEVEREFGTRKISRNNANIAVGPHHVAAVTNEDGILIWDTRLGETQNRCMGPRPPLMQETFRDHQRGSPPPGYTCRRCNMEGHFLEHCNSTLPQDPFRFKMGDYVAVAAGERHVLALARDGTVSCWGDNEHGQAPPQGFFAGNYVSVAAGGISSLALTREGCISCLNEYGPCYPPPVGDDFVAIAAGRTHAVALRRGGRIMCWGSIAQAPEGEFVAIAAGDCHCLALRRNGSVACWGDNTSGQAPPDGVNGEFISISAGGSQSMGLISDGTVQFWGKLNFSTSREDNQFVAIGAGNERCAGIRHDGCITSWGKDGAVLREAFVTGRSLFLTKVDLL